MENFKQSIEEPFSGRFTPKAEQINTLIKKLNDTCYPKTQESFAEFCVTVYDLSKLFDGYTIEYQVGYGKYKGFAKVMADFGFDKTQTSRILKCYEKYIENGKMKSVFFPFSKSKLFELLLVDTEQLEHDIRRKVITDKATVTLLRKYVKNWQAMKKSQLDQEEKEEIDESEIPMKYDPSQIYEYSYFEGKTKTQLLNIVWKLQKFAHK